MIIKEFYSQRSDGVKLYRTYSDVGMKIVQDQTGIEYDDAIDVESAKYTYSETNTPIISEEDLAEDMIDPEQTLPEQDNP